jgi:hypothetical protein
MDSLIHRDFLEQAYAIVNPLQVPMAQFDGIPSSALIPPGMERHARMMPRLLDLRALGNDERMDLLERSDKWLRTFGDPMFSMLIESNKQPAQVVAHLLKNMVMSRADGKRFWLRFHDPRVFQHLPWILDAGQLWHLMGRSRSWCFYDVFQQKWSRVELPELDDRTLPRFHFSPRQWEALDLLQPLNDALTELQERHESIPEGALARVIEGLCAASANGLHSAEDQCEFALQWFHEGESMLGLPLVRQALLQANAEGGSYLSIKREMEYASSSPTVR